MSIDEFIKIVAPKLKLPTKKVYDHIVGSELRLTGVKDVKGKPIEDSKTYKMLEHIEIVDWDHERKLKLAWLRGGKLAVKTYLKKWLTEKQVELIIGTLPKTEKEIEQSKKIQQGEA